METSQYEFRTERLGFRRYLTSDIEGLREVFSDPYAARFYPKMQNAEALEGWINWNLSNYMKYGFGLWAIELLDCRKFIGDAGLTWQTIGKQQELEIGYHIHPQYRGLGYASEAAQECLKYAFVHLKAESVCSIVDPDNIASQKVSIRLHSTQKMFQGTQGPMLLFTTNASQFVKRFGSSEKHRGLD